MFMNEQEKQELWSHQKHLYVSSHIGLIPIFLSIYSERYDLLWISTSILLTSLLRWGYRDKEIYQYIDHNWVKFIYIYIWLSLFYYCAKKKEFNLECVFLSGFLLTILFLFLLEYIVWFVFKSYVFIPIHMIIHFLAVFIIITCMHMDYDLNQTMKQCVLFIQEGVKYIASLVQGV